MIAKSLSARIAGEKVHVSLLGTLSNLGKRQHI